MSLLSVLVAAYAIGVYGFGPGAGILPLAFRESFGSRPLAVAAHIFASATALLLGPVQFSSRVRVRWPGLHRVVGRVYLGLAVPIGGLAGLYLSGFAFGGITTTLGFGLLAVVWLYTALRGYVTARARDFAAHSRWMVRNYSLTFAAVTLRLYLPVSQVLEVPFDLSYQLISWLCWVPNLMIGECLIRVLRSPSAEGPLSRPRRPAALVEDSAPGEHRTAGPLTTPGVPVTPSSACTPPGTASSRVPT
jgi:uncharacterized membrane protein